MEAQVSEILENILGHLGLEGSFEVAENEEEVMVTIETTEAGRLIGYRGETLDSLQLLVNQIVAKRSTTFKRVIIDVENWRKNREADLIKRAGEWVLEVKESGKVMELEPMPSWQRRVVHMVVSETDGVESESVGEGRDRHLTIKPISKSSKKESPKSKKQLED